MSRNGRTATGNGKATRAARRMGAPEAGSERLKVLKTYKVFINGQFPRTESGRYYVAHSPAGSPLANVCRCSRKDLRDAVVAARNAQEAWAGRSAYNRGQILYRIAEVLEGRSEQFVEELVLLGAGEAEARTEVASSVDRFVYYAGWADKYQQVFSSVNPVASPHFCFSTLEPMGVVGLLAGEAAPLLGLVSLVAPTIVGGNTAVALASMSRPLPAVTLGEVLATSDLPAGVVNILTGERAELLEHFGSHMDINAVVYAAGSAQEAARLRELACGNVKRVIPWDEGSWAGDSGEGPYHITALQEVKTTWHPIGF